MYHHLNETLFPEIFLWDALHGKTEKQNLVCFQTLMPKTASDRSQLSQPSFPVKIRLNV